MCPTFATPWTETHQTSLSITNSWSLVKLVSIQSMISSNHPILCHPILLPSIFTSIWVFSNDSVLHIRWPKYWSISYSVSSLNEYSGLISFRMDWLISAFEGTLKSLLQHHNSKESSLQCSVFFMVQHTSIYNSWKNQSFDYMDLCQQSMSLLFNMLSLFVIAFVPRSIF